MPRAANRYGTVAIFACCELNTQPQACQHLRAIFFLQPGSCITLGKSASHRIGVETVVFSDNGDEAGGLRYLDSTSSLDIGERRCFDAVD
jgi:hypothetical protein